MITKELKAKRTNQTRRAFRTRSRIHGSVKIPRLSVCVSSHHVSAQLIDDNEGRTLVAVTTVGQKIAAKTMTEKAAWVGEQIGEKAKSAKIKQVVFDRGAKKYHGRVAALADAAREKGLKI